MRKLSYVMWILILLVGVLTGIACKETPTPSIPNTTQPELSIERFELVETTNGVKKWKLTANEAQFFEDVVKLKEVNVIFFRDDQAILSLSGENGIFHRQKKEIRVYSNVVAVSKKDKTRLTTASLIWQPDPGILTTPSKFTFIRNGTRIEGTGLKMDPAMERLEIKEKVAIEIGHE